MGSGTGSKGSVRGDELLFSVGIKVVVVVLVAFLLLQQLLMGSGVTCRIGVVGVDGVGVEGSDGEGWLQQPPVFIFGASGRRDSILFFLAAVDRKKENIACLIGHKYDVCFCNVPGDMLMLVLLVLFFFVAPRPF